MELSRSEVPRENHSRFTDVIDQMSKILMSFIKRFEVGNRRMKPTLIGFISSKLEGT